VNIHGPTAVWYCVGCHDPEATPVRYQFLFLDPWTVTRTTQAVEPLLYTFSSAEVFLPGKPALASEMRARDMLRDMIEHLKA
jgi:hypothetical protein